MSSDPNKKSARTFQCRDMLWETFEQMATELECSVDYLVNEAMKQYARQRSYGTRTPYSGVGPNYGPRVDSGATDPPLGAYPGTPSAATTVRGQTSSAPVRPPSGAVPPPPRSVGVPAPPPPPGRSSHSLPPPIGPMGSDRPLGTPYSGRPGPSTRSSGPPARSSGPPPIPSGRLPSGPPAFGSAPTASTVSGVTLSLIYQGEKFPVTKDRFVIGRGKQSSDFTLKDPNVSRQHAMVEFQNGIFFMVDMGSTNGVEFNGQRIARKQISEGDVFRICDHDVRFTYR